MPEIKGYTCDGGCGATCVLEKSTDTPTRYGWYMTFTPQGYPTLYTCSLPCLSRAALALDNGPRQVSPA